MPLSSGKGPKAFSHNVAAEMGAGKPQKQALAIAYAVKRKNRKAMGGMVNEDLHPQHDASREAESMVYDTQKNLHIDHAAEPMQHVMAAKENMPIHMLSHGGMADMIMRKRMADGGMCYADGGYVGEGHENSLHMDDDFLSEDMEPMDDGDYDHVDNSNGASEHELASEDNPKVRRKGILKSIMGALHVAHKGA